MLFKKTIKEIQEMHKEFELSRLETRLEEARKMQADGEERWNKYYSITGIIEATTRDIERVKKGEQIGSPLSSISPSRSNVYILYLLTGRREDWLVLNDISGRLFGTTYGHAKSMKSSWEEGTKKTIKELGYTRYNIQDGKFVKQEKVEKKDVNDRLEIVIDGENILLAPL